HLYFLSSTTRRLPISTLFPYTTLFRSHGNIMPLPPALILLLRILPVAIHWCCKVPEVMWVLLQPLPELYWKLAGEQMPHQWIATDRKSTRLNSSHDQISYAVFCLKKKT